MCHMLWRYARRRSDRRASGYARHGHDAITPAVQLRGRVGWPEDGRDGILLAAVAAIAALLTGSAQTQLLGHELLEPLVIALPARRLSCGLTIIAMAGFGVDLSAIRVVGPRVAAAVVVSLALLAGPTLVPIRALGITGGS